LLAGGRRRPQRVVFFGLSPGGEEGKRGTSASILQAEGSVMNVLWLRKSLAGLAGGAAMVVSITASGAVPATTTPTTSPRDLSTEASPTPIPVAVLPSPTPSPLPPSPTASSSQIPNRTVPSLIAPPGSTFDFSFACDQAVVTIPFGSGLSMMCTITSTGTAGPVGANFYCGQPPPGPSITCAFSPNFVDVPLHGSARIQWTITVGREMYGGSYTMVAIAGANVRRTFDTEVRVPDYSLSCSPSDLSNATAATEITTCTVRSLGYFSDSVQFSCRTADGIWCYFDKSSVSPPAGGSSVDQLTIQVRFDVTPGKYLVTLVGQSGTRPQRYSDLQFTVQ
jgi:hypothetical protein